MSIGRKEKRSNDRGQDTPTLRRGPQNKKRTNKPVRQVNNQREPYPRSQGEIESQELKEKSIVSKAADGWMR